jgi:hypothetical protein
MSLKAVISFTFIDEQNSQLFVVVLVSTQFKVDEKLIAAKEKTEMKKQILLNEFKTRILVIFTSDASISKSLTLIKESENDEDKISSEVKTHRTRFAELSSNEIVKIFIEKFKSINIYKLRHMRDLTHDFYYDQNRIEIENDQIKLLKKIMRIFKDFEKFFYEIYFESFINY